jgi:hypothetical protein
MLIKLTRTLAVTIATAAVQNAAIGKPAGEVEVVNALARICSWRAGPGLLAQPLLASAGGGHALIPMRPSGAEPEQHAHPRVQLHSVFCARGR